VGREALLEVRMARSWAIYCSDEDGPEARACPRHLVPAGLRGRLGGQRIGSAGVSV